MKPRKHVLLATGRYFPKIHRGVATYARENGWHLNAEPAQSQSFPEAWDGDGVITGLGGVAMNRFINSLDCPKVFLGKQAEDMNVVSISEDNQTIAKLAATHFLKRHFQNFAWYSRCSNRINERLTLFGAAVESAGFSCKSLIPATEENNWKKRHQWLGEKLQAIAKPIAIFAEMDETAAEIVEVCMDFGIMVPEEAAVLGVRNDELVCEAIPIPLSSVENDHELLGYEAARLLDRQMNGEDLGSTHVFTYPNKVISRQSTDVLAVPHPEVARALGFIKENYIHHISVDDIVRSTRLSKVGLYKAFQTHLQRTPAHELMRLRLQMAEKLLRQTDLKIVEIAQRSGFGDYHTLYFTMKRELGLTPKQLRGRSK